MNLTSPVLNGALRAADVPGDSASSLLRAIGDVTGISGADGDLGIAMSALAGVAAALAVAITLTVYFRARYRSTNDVIKHGVAAATVFALLAFVAYDMRHAALAYLGINPQKPAVEFEIRLPRTALSAVAGTQIELHTDRNQTLARLQGVAAFGDRHGVLRGSVLLDYRTTDRVVVLNQPGQPRRQFKLRLAASPSHSDQFGPWHLADRVDLPAGQVVDTGLNDAFAIRYRVL